MQKKLLEMLEWFHYFCVNNDITYYANGGTMLGALRHNGFIPWDDDVDVMIPREDYEKLVNLIGDKKYENYYLETPYGPNGDYVYPYAKLYDTRTTMIENKNTRLVRGVYIDIFPLDGLGNTKEEANKNFKRINKYSLLLTLRSLGFRKGRSLYKNFAILIVRMIPNFLINEKSLLREFDKRCAEKSYSDCRYVANCMGNAGYKGILEKTILGIPKEYTFENIVIWGPEHGEMYLEKVFGDWKQLPPEGQRMTTHSKEIDFNKPYYNG